MDCRLFLGLIALTAVAAQQSPTPLVVVNGTLGESVDFNLHDITIPPNYQITWTTGGTIIGRIYSNSPPAYNPMYADRCQLFPNGTLRLEKLTRDDERRYTVTVQAGFTSQTVDYQLNVYAAQPPSTPPVLVNGALGGSVDFNLFIALPQNYQLTWSTGGVIIVGRISNNPPLINPDYVNRCQLFPEGTLKLDKLTRGDEKLYTATVYNQDDRTGQTMDYQLNVYAYVLKGALGGSVDFNLYDITIPQIYLLTWSTGGVTIGIINSNNPPSINPMYADRCQLFPNGTLRLEKLTTADEGLYAVTVQADFTSQTVDYQLNIYGI